MTEAFYLAVTSSTGNLWDSSLSNFLYLLPGQSGTIQVDISADRDAVRDGGFWDALRRRLQSRRIISVSALPTGDELAAIPYQYTTG